MPKPKRRTPIVPVPKTAVQPSAPNHKQGQPQHLQKSSNQGHEQKAGLHDVGGGRAKRPRESNDPGAKPKSNKRRKGLASTVAQHGRDRGEQSSGLWRPNNVVHRQAAFAVKRLLEADSNRKHGASLKSLTLAPHIEAKKATFAVTCQVLKFSKILRQLDEQVDLTPTQPKLDKYVAMVLSYELLRGQGLQRNGPAERAVLAAEPRLRAALKTRLQEAGVESLDDLLQYGTGGGDGSSAGGGSSGPLVPHPRWVRVNLLKADVEDVVRQLDEHLRRHATEQREQEQGKQQQLRAAGKAQQQQQTQASMLQQQLRRQQQQQLQPPVFPPRVVRDALLPDLLALPGGTDLHDHPLVTRGSVVLQSKASCMPAHALAPKPGWTVLDCCAAPGNKTTHLAALLGNKGRVLAFDKDPKRLSRLRANAALTGSTCIEARLVDFLSLDPTAPEFREVRAVLLDPSCSGSGTTFTRMDHLLPSHMGPAAMTAAAAAATAAATATPAAASAKGPAAMAAATAAQGPILFGPSSATKGGGGAVAETSGACRQEEEEKVVLEEGGGQQTREKDSKRREKKLKRGVQMVAAPEDPPPPQLRQQQLLLPAGGPAVCPSEAARVAQLARFQSAALSHALRFPSLERLVYSTCSVHLEENEAVVAGALQQAAEAGLELADPFPSWHRRGLPLFPGAEKLVRTDAYLDGTDGFFVALFQRRRPPEPEGREQQPQKQPSQQLQQKHQHKQKQQQKQQQENLQEEKLPQEKQQGKRRQWPITGSAGDDSRSSEDPAMEEAEGVEEEGDVDAENGLAAATQAKEDVEEDDEELSQSTMEEDDAAEEEEGETEEDDEEGDGEGGEDGEDEAEMEVAAAATAPASRRRGVAQGHSRRGSGTGDDHGVEDIRTGGGTSITELFQYRLKGSECTSGRARSGGGSGRGRGGRCRGGPSPRSDGRAGERGGGGGRGAAAGRRRGAGAGERLRTVRSGSWGNN